MKTYETLRTLTSIFLLPFCYLSLNLTEPVVLFFFKTHMKGSLYLPETSPFITAETEYLQVSSFILSMLLLWHCIFTVLHFGGEGMINLFLKIEILHIHFLFYQYLYLKRWLSGKISACQCGRCRFDPWVRKIPWRRKCNPVQYSCLGNLMDI